MVIWMSSGKMGDRRLEPIEEFTLNTIGDGSPDLDVIETQGAFSRSSDEET
jgi:hypothetical protein